MTVNVTEAGKPSGKIDSYSFPTSANVNEKKDFSLVIHNNGGAAGIIWAGIGNLSGNPGKIVITVGGKDYTVDPGYVFIAESTSNIAVCSKITVSGQVMFTAKGKYTVRLYGGHKEDTGYVYDSYVDVNG